MSLLAEPIRVLHIDGDPSFAALAAEHLEGADERINVTSVGDGRDVCSMLMEGGAFDCVVCGYELPGPNGIAILEAVRETHPELPFILFTGKGSEAVASDAISAGVTDYLRKGDGEQFEVLANSIRNAVGARRARERLDEQEKALERERAFIDEALTTLDDVFYVVNEDGAFRRWNDELSEITGYTDDQIAEMQITDLFPEEHRDRARETFRQIIEAGESSLEAPLLAKDGDEIVHEFSGTLVEEPEGQARWLVGVGRDVSDRRQRERRLRELKQRYGVLFNHADDALFLIDVERDADGEPEFRFQALNSSHEDRTGLDSEEIGGRRPHEVLGDELGSRVVANYHRCVEQGEPITYQETLELPGGTRTWDTKLSPVEVEDEIVQIVGVSRDVTDRQQRKQELESFQRAVEQAADGVAILEDDAYVFVDQTHVDMYGFDSREDLIGKTWRELYDGEEIARLEEEVFPVLAEEGYWRGEVTGTRPDGSQFPAELQLTIIDDGRLVCACRDMTERKERERQLARRTRRLETLVSNLPGVVYRCRNEHGWPMAHVGGECEALTGYEAEMFEQGEVSWDRLIHPDDREEVWEQVQASLTAGEPYELEYRMRDRSGEIIWVYERGRAVEDAEDGTEKLEGFVMDVTERKERKQELQRESRRYQATLEDPNILAGRLDPEGRLQEVNRTAMAYVDADVDDVTEQPIWDGPWWGDDEELRDHLRSVVETASSGMYEEYEASLEKPDGEPYHVEGFVRPVKDEKGEVVSIVISARDVTERKRRERALRETNRRLEAVLETAEAGIFIKDADRRYQLMNPRVREMFGIAEDRDVTGCRDEDLVPEELVEGCGIVDESVLQDGEPATVEKTYQTPEGPRTLLSMKSPMTDEQGNVVGVCGVVTDITDRDRREQELRLKTRAMDEAPLGIVLTDPTREDNPIVYVNDRFEELTGYEEDEILGRNCRFLQGEATDAEPVARMREAIEAGEPVTVELRNERADGTEFWNRVSIAPVRDPDGELTHFVGFQQDVTHRWKAEQQLRRSERSLRELYDITSDGDRSFEQKIEALLELGVQRLQLPQAILAEVDLEAGLQRIRASHGSPNGLDPGTTVPVGESYCRKTLEQGTMVALEDTREAFAGDPAEDRFDLGAYAGAPIRVDDEVWGTICFASPQPRSRRFTNAELVFVELVSQWIGYELARRRTEAELREKNGQLDEFASIISHDLRNPLNVASGNLSLAREVDGVESPRLDTIKRAHERMGDLIDEVLTLARYGEDVADIGEVRLERVARRAWGNVETGEAELVTEDGLIDADESRLVQLLENLHRNAIEHAGPETTVGVGPLAEGFYVEDDGSGIPEPQRVKVLESGYSTAEDGTGFGLSIVRRIAEAHGWQMRVTEGSEGGARFEFRAEGPS